MRREGDAGREGRPEREPRRAGVRPRLILLVLFGVLLVVFAAANFRPVHVSFLLFAARARVVTVIVVAGALGFLAGFLAGRPTREERRRLRADRDRDER